MSSKEPLLHCRTAYFIAQQFRLGNGIPSKLNKFQWENCNNTSVVKENFHLLLGFESSMKIANILDQMKICIQK